MAPVSQYRTFRGNTCETITNRLLDGIIVSLRGKTGKITVFREVEGTPFPVLTLNAIDCETVVGSALVPAGEIIKVCAEGVIPPDCLTVAIDESDDVLIVATQEGFDSCCQNVLVNITGGASDETCVGVTAQYQDGGVTYIRADGTVINQNVLTVTSVTDLSTCCPPDPAFITQWQTTAPLETITLPLVTGFNYDFLVSWGDGSFSEITAFDDPDITHTYVTAGTYDVKITGVCETWSFNNLGDKDKIFDILNWGNVGFTSCEAMFHGCSNLTNISATTNPAAFALVTTFEEMFHDCANLINVDTTGWVSSVATNLNLFFRIDGNLVSVGDTGTWDVSNVTTAKQIFQSCTLLLVVNVTTWNTGKLENIFTMMSGCTSVSIIDVSNWNTPVLQDIRSAFQNTSGVFRFEVSNWDWSSVTLSALVFSGSGFSQIDYDPLLISLDSQTLNSAVTFHAGGAKFGAGAPATARASIVGPPDNWVITDGGPA